VGGEGLDEEVEGGAFLQFECVSVAQEVGHFSGQDEKEWRLSGEVGLQPGELNGRWVRAIRGLAFGVGGRVCWLRAVGPVGFTVDFENDGAVDNAFEEGPGEV